MSDLDTVGYACLSDAVTAALLADLCATASCEGAGSRMLLNEPSVRATVAHLRSASPVAALLPADHVAVQCTLFAKRGDSNWGVAPHQDLSIPVAERIDHDACRGWSQKEGQWFVQSPAELLAELLAVRIQLDEPSDDSGELRVAPGTHRLGRIASARVHEYAPFHTLHECRIARGGALAMRPLLVHASGKAAPGVVRRVMHLLFGPPILPLGLRWAHAV